MGAILIDKKFPPAYFDRFQLPLKENVAEPLALVPVA